MRRLLPLASLFCLIAAAPAAAKPPVWVVRDKDSQIVIFGSMHVLPAGVDWRPEPLDQAVGKADDVWFELPVDPATQTAVAQLAAVKGKLPPGQTLSSKLDPATRDRLAQAQASLGMPPGALEPFQPWLAEIALAGAVFAKHGASGSDGVEQSVARSVPASAQRKAFETAEQQIDMFAGSPMADQIASLKETLDEIDDGPAAFKALLDAWVAGDVKVLQEKAVEPVRRASPRLYARLINDRNARWAKVLSDRMKGSGRTVVVVGAGHLVGPDGVPARLRAMGFAVEGP
jgi:uncharacterized protein